MSQGNVPLHLRVLTAQVLMIRADYVGKQLRPSSFAVGSFWLSAHGLSAIAMPSDGCRAASSGKTYKCPGQTQGACHGLQISNLITCPA